MNLVPKRTTYNPSTRSWIWQYVSNENEESYAGNFEIKAGDVLRFKVDNIVYTVTNVTIKGKTATIKDMPNETPITKKISFLFNLNFFDFI